MSGVLNSGLEFWQIMGLIGAFTTAFIAVKVTLNFDLNKYLERKDKRLDLKLKNTCTHMHMELVGQDNGKAQYKFQSLFESPSGTSQWQCQRCGLVRNHDNDYEKRAEHYAQNPDDYIKRNKKFQKLLRKNGAT